MLYICIQHVQFRHLLTQLFAHKCVFFLQTQLNIKWCNHGGVLSLWDKSWVEIKNLHFFETFCLQGLFFGTLAVRFKCFLFCFECLSLNVSETARTPFPSSTVGGHRSIGKFYIHNGKNLPCVSSQSVVLQHLTCKANHTTFTLTGWHTEDIATLLHHRQHGVCRVLHT